MKKMISLAAVLFVAVALAPGCAELEKNRMSQAAASMSADISSALKSGIEQGVRDFQAQAGVQAINPQYTFKATVTVGTVVDIDGSIGLAGVAGQMSANAASGRDTVSEEAPQ